MERQAGEVDDESTKGLENQDGEGEDSRGQENEDSRGLESEDPRRMESEGPRRKAGRSTKVARKGKLRGPNRQTQTLGGIKKQKKALMGKAKRRVNREKGKAGIPAKKKSKDETDSRVS